MGRRFYTAAKPTKCLEKNPTTQSVEFCGEFINLSAIARADPTLEQSYLSHIFKGKRVPSMTRTKRIASALGMSLERCAEALEQKRDGLKLSA